LARRVGVCKMRMLEISLEEHRTNVNIRKSKCNKYNGILEEKKARVV